MPDERSSLPGEELTRRVGWLYDGSDGARLFDELGRASREEIISMLPSGWTFEGRRVLDFGCGAGRILRHFLPEAERCELWGCDIDAPSIRWLQEHLAPPLHVFRNDALPPLPLDEGSLDLVWAASVFTHLATSWSAWMIEMRRILAPGGLLLASYIGEGTSVPEAADWDEDRIGMNVIDGGLEYDQGGPVVLHSRWWIHAHWSRAFEILSLRPPEEGSQGWVLMRRREAPVTEAELDAVAPGEQREHAALAHNVRQVERRHRDAVLRERATADQLSALRASRSWRLTAPLRRLGGRGS